MICLTSFQKHVNPLVPHFQLPLQVVNGYICVLQKYVQVKHLCVFWLNINT